MKDIAYYWDCIPTNKENAISYGRLCSLWNCDKRRVRSILHNLSMYDEDDYILIRSSQNKGFYKTLDRPEIIAYRQECLNRGKRTFAPIKKINRVLADEEGQIDFMLDVSF